MEAFRRAACVLGLLLFHGLLARPGGAQVVRGVVVDSDTGVALSAVLAILVDEAERDLQRYLVDANGEFQLEAPGPGVYAVRVERLGADTDRLVGLRLEAGDTVRVRIPMRQRSIALGGIDVHGDQRCELPHDAEGETQSVWEEARKALTAASLTDSMATYRYSLVKYRRELHPASLTVRRGTESRQTTMARRPIASRPIEALLGGGFVVPDAGGDRYYAPDAYALLSEAFLESHCFLLKSGDGGRSDLIGLAFRPIRVRSQTPDIEGELWLERDSGALRWLDFRYTSLPGLAEEVRNSKIGGRVDFHGLPDGTWIVSRWHIRMPIAVEVQEPLIRRRRVRLEGIAEEGGRVASARRLGTGTLAFTERPGTIVGRLSSGGTGSVSVIGVGAKADVDETGSFRLGGLPEGQYEIAYLRPELMGLDREFAVVQAGVDPGEVTEVLIDPLPQAEIMASVCGMDAWDPTTGIVVGGVVDSRAGVAVAGASVKAEWQRIADVHLKRSRIAGWDRSIATRTDASGAFMVCGVPFDRTISVTASVEDRGSVRHEVFLSRGRPVEVLSVSLHPGDVPGARERFER
jgi:hypothetical protein